MLTHNHLRTGSQNGFNNGNGGSIHGYESTKYDINSNHKESADYKSEIPGIEEKFSKKRKNLQS